MRWNKRGLEQSIKNSLKRVSPFEHEVKLNVLLGKGEDWDYSTDLPSQVYEKFKLHQGFRNKASASMLHDEIAASLMPHEMIEDLRYLGNQSYIKMKDEYWLKWQETNDKCIILADDLRSKWIATCLSSKAQYRDGDRITFDELNSTKHDNQFSSSTTLNDMKYSHSNSHSSNFNSSQKNTSSNTTRGNSSTVYDHVWILTDSNSSRLSHLLHKHIEANRIETIHVSPYTVVHDHICNEQLSISEILDKEVSIDALRYYLMYTCHPSMPLCVSLSEITSAEELIDYKKGMLGHFMVSSDLRKENVEPLKACIKAREIVPSLFCTKGSNRFALHRHFFDRIHELIGDDKIIDVKYEKTANYIEKTIMEVL